MTLAPSGFDMHSFRHVLESDPSLRDGAVPIVVSPLPARSFLLIPLPWTANVKVEIAPFDVSLYEYVHSRVRELIARFRDNGDHRFELRTERGELSWSFDARYRIRNAIARQFGGLVRRTPVEYRWEWISRRATTAVVWNDNNVDVHVIAHSVQAEQLLAFVDALGLAIRNTANG